VGRGLCLFCTLPHVALLLESCCYVPAYALVWMQ
jgi:hypothetical protein